MASDSLKWAALTARRCQLGAAAQLAPLRDERATPGVFYGEVGTRMRAGLSEGDLAEVLGPGLGGEDAGGLHLGGDLLEALQQ